MGDNDTVKVDHERVQALKLGMRVIERLSFAYASVDQLPDSEEFYEAMRDPSNSRFTVARKVIDRKLTGGIWDTIYALYIAERLNPDDSLQRARGDYG